MKEKDYSREFWLMLMNIAFFNMGYFLSNVFKPIIFIFLNASWIFLYILLIGFEDYLIKHKVKLCV